MEEIKRLLRGLFYRSAAARLVIGIASLLSGRTQRLRVAHLLAYVDSNAVGPLQTAEALLVNAIVQVILPKVVVEFGFFKGHSAFNFLQALGPEAKLYSYDIAPDSARLAGSAFGAFKNFRFYYKSQDKFTPGDIENQKVDLLFFDAVHDLELNKKTWRQIESSLAERAVVIVHDTGTWTRAHAIAVHGEAALKPQLWLNDAEYEHQPEERQFVNWLSEEHQYSAVQFHTLDTLRHGVSVLQRSQPLPTRRRSSELPLQELAPKEIVT